MNLAELQRKVDRTKKKDTRLQRRKYWLARRLGFSSREAAYLRMQTEETIRVLGREKAEKSI